MFLLLEGRECSAMALHSSLSRLSASTRALIHRYVPTSHLLHIYVLQDALIAHPQRTQLLIHAVIRGHHLGFSHIPPMIILGISQLLLVGGVFEPR